MKLNLEDKNIIVGILKAELELSDDLLDKDYFEYLTACIQNINLQKKIKIKRIPLVHETKGFKKLSKKLSV